MVRPQPERPEFVALFDAQIRRYGERHRVKAGVTGWAQVHGLRGQTSIAGVFAAGDATTVPYKQIVIAMGQGATAALSAFDHLIRTSAPTAAAVAQSETA